MKNGETDPISRSDSSCKSDFNIILSGSEINENCFDVNAEVRSASLDMLPDCIIRNGKKIEIEKNSSEPINPQEMFIVVLKGNIVIPNNCIGIAYPKTSLTQKGLHVLNTGIVDPGYNGYLSTIVMNYSNKPLEIRANDVFLRLMICKKQEPFPITSAFKITYDDYINARKKDSEKYRKHSWI